MKAADIMTTDVVTAPRDFCVQDVAELLLKHRISAVPVVDSSGTLVGMVSEGDLLRRAEAETERRRPWWLEMLTGSDALASEYVKEHSRKISDVMTRNVVTAKPESSLGEIAALLEKNHIKRVPIVDNGKVVGIVSRANIVQAVAALKKELEATVKPDDSALREKVLERLKAEPWRPFLLNVTVHNGQVDLWGIVDSKSQKAAARVAAEVIPGVVAVNDNLVIRPVAYAE